jgi:membrane protease YdiL (CAAX protease family)
MVVISACALTILAMVAQADPETNEFFDFGKFGVAQAVGFGIAATLAARLVPEPRAERLGLRGFPRHFTPLLLALVPMIFVISEIDNWISLVVPTTQPSPEQIVEARDSRTLLTSLQIAIALIGIKPVVEEWLFRGVVLQGAIAHLGRPGGLVFTSAICALVPMPLVGGSAASMVLTSFLSALCLGVVRISTGSLLAPILLHASWSALGLALTMWVDLFPIPGFNLPGGNTPPELLFPCMFAVIWALVASVKAMRDQPVVLPIVPAKDDEDDELGGFF